MAELKKRVASAPTEPGIYRWIDEKGTVLYVGKAKNLRNRLKSYVHKLDKNMGPWKKSLIEHIADYDITITSNELEALVLETNVIKEKKPKYNVLMKDDKNYVYVRISLNEPYPAVSIVRIINNDGAKYFGPYISAYDTQKLLNALHKIYEYKEEEKDLDRLNKAYKKGDLNTGIRPSLAYQIGESCGVSIGKISREQYMERIESIVRFFKGQIKDAAQKADNLMQEAANKKQFERAASLRDAMQIIDNMKEKQIASNTSGDNSDYIAIEMLNGKSQAVVLRERDGKIIDEQSFVLKGQADTMENTLEQFLQQYYANIQEIPDNICVAKLYAGSDTLTEWLTQRKGKQANILVPERGKKAQILMLAQKNAEEKLKSQEAKWEAAAKNIENALKELKEILKLDAIPKRIEGYDISHMGGTETVGSMVVAQSGKPANKEYRSFTIRTLNNGDIDDYKALAEVLKRRLRHLLADVKIEEENWKKKGYEFGKVKKQEQGFIEKTMKKNPNDFLIEDVDFGSFIVGRKKKDICSFARMSKYKDDTLELKSLWVSDDCKGNKLGQFLCKKIIQKYKKEKIYVTIHSKLEQYYAEIGFRHVHKPPKILEEEMQKTKKGSNFLDLFVMVSLPNERIKDASLSEKPDMIVIDGGKGQLSSAVKVLKEYGLEIPVIGLAKKEEDVFIPNKSSPVEFKKDSPAKFLLIRLRNEAHRFANLHREKRQNKSMIGSVLDEINGIGPKTKQALLDKFGSINAINESKDKELKTILNDEQIVELRKAFL